MVLSDKFLNNKGEQYSGGDVASCMFGIFLGAITLGGSMPQLKSIVEGKVSGYAIYSTIERTPSIRADDNPDRKVDKDKLVGNIEFKNVNFTYPTRPD